LDELDEKPNHKKISKFYMVGGLHNKQEVNMHYPPFYRSNFFDLLQQTIALKKKLM
jgi:hypothetical protein